MPSCILEVEKYGLHTIYFQSYGYGSKTFVTPETMMTIITLIRIPMSFLAMPVLTKFKRRPLYLSVCFFLVVTMSGIIAFTHLVETGGLKKTTLQGSIGYVNLNWEMILKAFIFTTLCARKMVYHHMCIILQITGCAISVVLIILFRIFLWIW